jgi:hypothetical protein
MVALILVAALMTQNARCSQGEGSAARVETPECVVLVGQSDSFLSLAREIAREDDLSVSHSLAEALHCDPEFMIWVASPDALNASALMQFGRELGRHRSSVAVGIITGSSIEQARALWSRREAAKADKLSFVSAGDGVIECDRAERVRREFNGRNIREALLRSSYVHYSGHGSSGSWAGFHSSEIPELPPIVVSAASCRTFRPSFSDNMARRFVDNGAVAYVGFPWSPVGDYFMGDRLGFPLRHSWPRCSLGHIVQILNQGSCRVFASYPQCFLLGDPRASLNKAAPARKVFDETGDGIRTIVYRDCPTGIVPLRITDGAKYAYVHAAGNTASSRSDLFFNCRLQFTDVRRDKFVLVQSDGGEVTLRLREITPKAWLWWDTLTDLLDLTLPCRTDASGITLVGFLVIFPIACWRAWKRRLPVPAVLGAVAVGVATSAVAWAYAWSRQGAATVTALPPDIHLAAYGAEALLVAGAAVVFLSCSSYVARALSVIWSTFPSFLIPLFLPAVWLMQHCRGVPDYSHDRVPLAFLAGVLVKAGTLYLVCGVLSRSVGSGSAKCDQGEAVLPHDGTTRDCPAPKGM